MLKSSPRRDLAPEQPRLFGGDEDTSPKRPTADSTFIENLSLPLHRWFRYSAGFSALWTREVIQQARQQGCSRVLDPFAGCGTVLLEGETGGLQAAGVEAHPFVARVAQAKLYWRVDPHEFRDYALAIVAQAREETGSIDRYPELMTKCFPPETLACLDTLRQGWEAVADGSPVAELTWLALASILRECSPVGTAQWQYVLPGKTKAKVSDPYTAFTYKIHLMSHDMALRQTQHTGAEAILHQEDARHCASVPDEWADLVITSPPYANNYDYADATRLEMSFFGDVRNWGDLQETVRKYLIRSCTQHVAKLNGEHRLNLDASILEPIRDELLETCRALELERLEHGGKKPYHAMIAAYFKDMAETWRALRRVTRNGALVCFVIGDSAPYGIYVPVDKWMGELAIAAGFKSYRFEKTRDRNVKWKNRKHRVPLHEGRLWVQG